MTQQLNISSQTLAAGMLTESLCCSVHSGSSDLSLVPEVTEGPSPGVCIGNEISPRGGKVIEQQHRTGISSLPPFQLSALICLTDSGSVVAF